MLRLCARCTVDISQLSINAIYCTRRCKRNALSERKAEDNKQYVRAIKDVTPCTDCHMIYPHYVMDFDHVSDDKVKNISDLVYKGRAALIAEIAKCELVCANCHRQRTHDRGYRILRTAQ